MTEADTNRAKLSFVEETTYGVLEPGNPTLQDIPYSGESLRQDTGTAVSATIRDDRQVADVIRTSVSAAGSINWELIFGAFPDLIASSFMSAGYSSLVTDTDTVYSLANADTSLNRASGDFAADGFVINQWVRISGFAVHNVSGNEYAKIATVAALKLTFSATTKTIVDESAGASVTVAMGPQVVNGTTMRSFDFEKHFTDLSGRFAVGTGLFHNGMNLAVNGAGIITGSFDYLGKMMQSGTSTMGDGSNTATVSNSVNNSVDNVKALFNGGTAIEITNFGWGLANNGRPRNNQVGSVGPVSIGTGQVGVTGTLQAYLIDAALIDEYLAFTNSSLAIVIEDEDGNGQIFDQPRLRWTSGQRVAGSANADIIADMGWTAYRHPTEDITARHVTFAA